MANEEQLSILKQGVEVWNEWRLKNLRVAVDLTGADLSTVRLARAFLSHADLSRADLTKADLSEANLSGANLSKARLIQAQLSRAQLVSADFNGSSLTKTNFHLAYLGGADLSDADLYEAILHSSDLSRAVLRRARLNNADLSSSNLCRADFTSADLSEANLRDANLSGASLIGSNLSKAKLFATTFGNSDISRSIGLEKVAHDGPSTIGIDAIAKSKGKIPEVFLRGCGLSDWEIEQAKLFDPNLSNDEVNKILYRMYDLRATQALQISPLFVSYSQTDGDFVNKVGKNLTEKGVRYWRDIHELKAGRMEKQIDTAIRQNPTVLLVLSKHSLSSDWVQHEIRTARELEKEKGRDVLCPVALDDSWKSSRWPKRLVEQIMEYNILDFSEWKDDGKFEGMFRKLIDGLELFYKG